MNSGGSWGDPGGILGLSWRNPGDIIIRGELGGGNQRVSWEPVS